MTSCLRINPRSIESWLARGKLKYRQAEIKLARNNLVLSVNGGSDEIAAASLFGGAISDFTRVLELDARIGEAWRWRGFAHLERGIILEEREIFAESDGAFGKAIADFTHALAINSADAEALSGRGEVHLWQNNSSEAYADFTRALALNPDDAYTRENRGDALRYQGNEEAAALDYIHAYMHAVRINPNSFEIVSLSTQVSLTLSNNPENQLALEGLKLLESVDKGGYCFALALDALIEGKRKAEEQARRQQELEKQKAQNLQRQGLAAGWML